MTDKSTDWVDRKVDAAQQLYESHGRVFRVMWVLVAGVIVLAGLAMTVLPGPVTIVVPAGLVMLAAVFGWARRLLLLSVRKGVDAKDRVKDLSTKVKVLGSVALGCLAAAAVAVVVLVRM